MPWHFSEKDDMVCYQAKVTEFPSLYLQGIQLPAKETNWGEIAFFWSRKKSKVTNEVLCQAKIKLILNNGRNNDRGDD